MCARFSLNLSWEPTAEKRRENGMPPPPGQRHFISGLAGGRNEEILRLGDLGGIWQ